MTKKQVNTADILVLCNKVGDEYQIAQGKPAFVCEDHVKQFAEKDLSVLQLHPIKLTLLLGVE